MRHQISAICASIFQVASNRLAKYGLYVLLGSLSLNAQSSFAYSLTQPEYQQGEMEISPEQFRMTRQSVDTEDTVGSKVSSKTTASSDKSQGKAQPKLSAEQQKQIQKLSKVLPKMPQPILTEIARLSGEKDLLLLFGADKFYTFLGCVNCSANEALSIWNARGPFGSSKSKYSIWSPSNEFGNEQTQYSPWNQFGRTPPIMIDTRGNVHGVLTLNQYNSNQSKTATATFLYKNFEQIRLNPSAWFKALFRDSDSPVLDIPETVLSNNHETDLNPSALQASINN